MTHLTVRRRHRSRIVTGDLAGCVHASGRAEREPVVPVRALVTLRLVGDAATAAESMKRVSAYTQEHFGSRVLFEPFLDEDSQRVVWLNTFADDGALAEWEMAMGESGLREEVLGPILDVVSLEMLDPTSDPRLEALRTNSVQLRSLLA
jgi:hypothetical protein